MMRPRQQDDESSEFRRSLRRLTVMGSAGVLLFAGTLGVWAVTTTLSGAVIATGQFVVDGNVKKVQHATGGIVGELKVREGDRVELEHVSITVEQMRPIRRVSSRFRESIEERFRLVVMDRFGMRETQLIPVGSAVMVAPAEVPP